jgi:hypothetical protein
VRWPPVCENVSAEAEERPLLEDVTKQRREDCNRVIVICKVQSRAVC